MYMSSWDLDRLRSMHVTMAILMQCSTSFHAARPSLLYCPVCCCCCCCMLDPDLALQHTPLDLPDCHLQHSHGVADKSASQAQPNTHDDWLHADKRTCSCVPRQPDTQWQQLHAATCSC